MRVVFGEFEVFHFEVFDVIDFSCYFHFGEFSWFTRDLLSQLIKVVRVNVRVPKCVNKLTRL